MARFNQRRIALTGIQRPAACELAGIPPEYNPATTQIVETVQVSPSRTEIKTKDSSRHAGEFTYILVLKKGKWLLDAKQYVDW
jgi:hypothetical protein